MREWYRNPVNLVMVGAGGLTALVVVVGLSIWISSRPPAPVVREGTIVAKQFVPAHEESYIQPQYVGQTCYEEKIGNSYEDVCSPHYIYIPMTRTIPDAWFITVKGCPRQLKDQPSTFCQKPKTRGVRVDETTYHADRIGATWRS